MIADVVIRMNFDRIPHRSGVLLAFQHRLYHRILIVEVGIAAEIAQVKAGVRQEIPGNKVP